jgi:ADP-ribose pyrophosphatase
VTDDVGDTPGRPGEPPAGNRRPAVDVSATDLTERVVETEVLHQGAYLDLRIDTIERADGSRAKREIVGHPGAVAIVAIDPNEQVLLVRQFRLAAGRVMLEIPAGTLDRDPVSGEVEKPDLAAARELEEETGYRAGRWEKLAGFWTAPGFATELMHLYLASDLTPARADRLGPDEDERLELDRLTWDDALEAVGRGEIADAKSIVGLLWVARARANLPPDDRIEAGPGALGEVEISFTWRMREVMAASMATMRASRGYLLFGISLMLLAVLPFAAGDVLIALPGLVGGAAILTGSFLVPFVWWQIRKRPELLQMPNVLSADHTGVSYRSPFVSGEYRWGAFRRVREMQGFFFLDTGAGANIIVPVRAFSPQQLSSFRRLLVEVGFTRDGHPVERRPT